MKITLSGMERRDIDRLTSIMKRAFDQDSLRHTGRPGGPPGYDTGEFLSKWGFHESATSLTISVDGAPAGAVILFIDSGTRTNTLGCLFLDPDVQRQGAGSAAWASVERMFPETKVWKTETIWHSTYNHYFYVEKCGFAITRIDNPRNNPQAQYHMEKRCVSPAGG